MHATAPAPGADLRADSDARVAGVRMLLHKTTPEWADWRERHVQSLPDMQAHTLALEHKRRDAGAAEGWIQANYLRYLQACPPSAASAPRASPSVSPHARAFLLQSHTSMQHAAAEVSAATPADCWFHAAIRAATRAQRPLQQAARHRVDQSAAVLHLHAAHAWHTCGAARRPASTVVHVNASARRLRYRAACAHRGRRSPLPPPRASACVRMQSPPCD